LEGDTFINYNYKETVQLRKLTQGKVHYKLRMEAKNKESLQVDIRARGQSLVNNGGILEGTIEDSGSGSIDLDIHLKSDECGKAIAYFFVEIEDGPPVSFSVQADFRGPIMSLSEPVVDLGLTKVNTQKTFTVTLENTSPIPASFILKSAKNKKMNFNNAINVDE